MLKELYRFTPDIWLVGWLFWVYRPFETIFQSISDRLPKRGRKRREKIDESKNVQTTATRTYCKRNRPLLDCKQNCRTPRHWKFTQHLCTPPQTFGHQFVGRSTYRLDSWARYITSCFKLLLLLCIYMIHLLTVFHDTTPTPVPPKSPVHGPA